MGWFKCYRLFDMGLMYGYGFFFRFLLKLGSAIVKTGDREFRIPMN
jgi:hypothetical protein